MNSVSANKYLTNLAVQTLGTAPIMKRLCLSLARVVNATATLSEEQQGMVTATITELVQKGCQGETATELLPLATFINTCRD